MSPWYQDSPKGALGTWITKKSKSVLGGKPQTLTVMISTGPTDSMWTRPRALGSTLAPAATTAPDRTISKVKSSPSLSLSLTQSQARAGVDARAATARAVSAAVFIWANRFKPLIVVFILF